MNRIALLAVLAVLSLAGCSDDATPSAATPTLETFGARAETSSSVPTAHAPAGYISEETWTQGPWPFTVPEGLLMCATAPRGPSITFTAARVMYGLNGTAQAQGLPKPDPIWKTTPSGLRVDIGTALEKGRALC